MRNPIRPKNLALRFAPAALLGLALLALSRPDLRTIAIGAPLVVSGLGVRAWAVGHLVKTERFTCTGPYAHLRHPLYLGTLSIGLGISVMLGGVTAWIGAALVLAWFASSYMPRKERVETERLLARHGAVYERYHAEVPALWPRLHAWRPASGLPSHEGGGERWRFERFDANNELGTEIAVAIAVAAVGLRAALV